MVIVATTSKVASCAWLVVAKTIAREQTNGWSHFASTRFSFTTCCSCEKWISLPLRMHLSAYGRCVGECRINLTSLKVPAPSGPVSSKLDSRNSSCVSLRFRSVTCGGRGGKRGEVARGEVARGGVARGWNGSRRFVQSVAAARARSALAAVGVRSCA